MTRPTFGVSASSFAANMAVKQNSFDLAHDYPLAAKVVQDCFGHMRMYIIYLSGFEISSLLMVVCDKRIQAYSANEIKY